MAFTNCYITVIFKDLHTMSINSQLITLMNYIKQNKRNDSYIYFEICKGNI